MIMKQLLYILTVLVTGHHLYAQYHIIPNHTLSHFDIVTTVDSGNIRLLYAVNAENINDTKTYDDLHRLDIGTQMSKYYSFYLYNSDSLKHEAGKKKLNAPSGDIWLGERGKKSLRWEMVNQSIFFKEFSKNVLTVYIRMPMSITPCQYSEEIPVQEWQLHDDTLTVCGNLCQKATCRFRGRDFVAWFAMELPIQNGPWKFGGLPGLILKVQDEEKMYDFECVKIDYHENKYPITMFDNKRFQKTEREKASKLEKDFYADFYNVAGWKNMDGTPLKPTAIPYHPLEME